MWSWHICPVLWELGPTAATVEPPPVLVIFYMGKSSSALRADAGNVPWEYHFITSRTLVGTTA